MIKETSYHIKVARTLLMVSKDMIKRIKELHERVKDIDQKLEHVINSIKDLRFQMNNSNSNFKYYKH